MRRSGAAADAGVLAGITAAQLQGRDSAEKILCRKAGLSEDRREKFRERV